MTASPRKNPLTGLEVSRSKIVLSLLPAAVQALAHDGHAEQEQGQSPQHGQKVKNIHSSSYPVPAPAGAVVSLSNKIIISKICVKHNHL